MKTALITGASGGIGKELAVLFAKDNHNLVLVARSIDKLNQLSKELVEKYKINCIVIKSDLSVAGAATKLYKEIMDKNINIDFLINNAGFGDFGYLSINKIDKYREMINLNIMALTELTIMYANDMKSRGFGKIMNVGSTASFQPVPFFSVYAASKAYVLSFTEALSYEFKNSGVLFTTLCPGPTDTDFAKAADMNNTSMFDLEKGNGMTAKKVAEIGYKGFMNNQMTIVTGFKNKMNAYFSPKLPSRKMVLSLVGSIFRKNLK